MWENSKKGAMTKLHDAEKTGDVDIGILPLLDVINGKSNYYTTSSCSGRIALISSPHRMKSKTAFLARWHDTPSFDEVWDAAAKSEGEVWFRVEPLILHIECEGVEDALRLVELKNRLSLKRGGLNGFGKRRDKFLVEIRADTQLAFPLRLGGKLLITSENFQQIFDVAAAMMHENKKVLSQLEKEFRKL